ncbi:MAG: hypothetical protein CMK54_06400 [Proteobacteria bacterium]|nr:hypothetical protein [Pseudomonadota bacterium]
MRDYGFLFDTTYTNLPKQFFIKSKIGTIAEPKIVVFNDELSEMIGLKFSDSSSTEKSNIFSGNDLPEGVDLFSQAYAGHQFGHFTMLGDGRAHVWGEHITPSGIRLDIQFKGSGRTPYSRNGDGKAALGPMLREYIISESLFNLGISTTRSLAVVSTGEPIMREMVLPGAILTRVASSHIRVGTFEFAAAQSDKNVIKSLIEYTIKRHYPSLINKDNKELTLIRLVMEKQVDLIVHWMRVGFIHGVMNTDNMTISGETIDYGPCAFMDTYDPNKVFSSIDHGRRYAYDNQPKVAQWNLARLAESILLGIESNIEKVLPVAEGIINEFSVVYKKKWLAMMGSKLGLFFLRKDDEKLIYELLDWMEKNNADFTKTFRDLSNATYPHSKIFDDNQFRQWFDRWQNRLKYNDRSLQSAISLMKSVNPNIIPRNHIVDQVLKSAESGDFKPLSDLLIAIKEPYKERTSISKYEDLPKPNEQILHTYCGT